MRVRPVRIMVETQDKTYSEVMRKLQTDLPQELKDGVMGARKSKAGNMVLRLSKG